MEIAKYKIPNRGANHGPCLDGTKEDGHNHGNCSKLLEQAETPCAKCGDAIGFETEFDMQETNKGMVFSHFDCPKDAKEPAAELPSVGSVDGVPVNKETLPSLGTVMPDAGPPLGTVEGSIGEAITREIKLAETQEIPDKELVELVESEKKVNKGKKGKKK